MENQLMLENWIYPSDDYIINFDQWKPGNPLFITGASGDGKSTLARKLGEEYNAIVVSSDVVLLRLFKTEQKWNDIIQKIQTDAFNAYDSYGIDFNDEISMDYITSNPNIPYQLKDPVTKKTDNLRVSIEMCKFYKWFMRQTESNPKYNRNLYILEGCNVCQLSPELMSTKPLIIVGGSRLQSFIRRVKRDVTKENKGVVESIFKFIRKYTKNHKVLDDEKDTFLKGLKCANPYKECGDNSTVYTYNELLEMVLESKALRGQ